MFCFKVDAAGVSERVLISSVDKISWRGEEYNLIIIMAGCGGKMWAALPRKLRVMRAWASHLNGDSIHSSLIDFKRPPIHLQTSSWQTIKESLLIRVVAKLQTKDFLSKHNSVGRPAVGMERGLPRDK